ncbi:hypothetical protein ABR763_01090 [Bacillus cereus]
MIRYLLILKDINGEILHFPLSDYTSVLRAEKLRPRLIPKEYVRFMETKHMTYLGIAKERY